MNKVSKIVNGLGSRLEKRKEMHEIKKNFRPIMDRKSGQGIEVPKEHQE